MASGKKLASGRRSTSGKKGTGGAAVFWIVVLIVLVLCGVGTALDSAFGDNSTAVPAPASDFTTDAVSSLQTASQAQGICYGWRLQDGTDSQVVSVGSNLGDGIAVDGDSEACPRWVEIVATVVYTSSSSEQDDYASVFVEGSPDLSTVGVETGLTRLGLDNAAFVDDPARAICQAAVSLPLLMAEVGEASIAPEITVAPSGTASPLPDAGSDFWRDRWGYLLGALACLLIAALLFWGGWHQRRQAERPAQSGKQQKAERV